MLAISHDKPIDFQIHNSNFQFLLAKFVIWNCVNVRWNISSRGENLRRRWSPMTLRTWSSSTAPGTSICLAGWKMFKLGNPDTNRCQSPKSHRRQKLPRTGAKFWKLNNDSFLFHWRIQLSKIVSWIFLFFFKYQFLKFLDSFLSTVFSFSYSKTWIRIIRILFKFLWLFFFEIIYGSRPQSGVSVCRFPFSDSFHLSFFNCELLRFQYRFWCYIEKRTKSNWI